MFTIPLPPSRRTGVDRLDDLGVASGLDSASTSRRRLVLQYLVTPVEPEETEKDFSSRSRSATTFS